MITASTRFWSKVNLLDQSGCWLWLAGTSHNGYGRFRAAGGDRINAHRFAYEELTGQLIPEGLVLDHLCRTPACVNPAHLEPVTRRENTLRGDSPPARRSRATGCEKGHPFTVENTRMRGAWRACRACDRERDARRGPRKKLDA